MNLNLTQPDLWLVLTPSQTELSGMSVQLFLVQSYCVAQKYSVPGGEGLPDTRSPEVELGSSVWLWLCWKRTGQA